MNASIFETSIESRGQGRRFAPQHIQEHLGAFRRSGLSAAAYARQQNLSYSTLLYWLKSNHRPSLRRAALGRAKPPAFQALSLNSLVGPAWAAELVGSNGLTVRLSGQVPPALATELMRLVCRP